MLRKYYSKFVWLPGENIKFNHSASNSIKSLLITFSTSPEVTSEYCWECLSNKWKIWWMLSSLWRATCHAWHEAYNCSTSSKYNPEKALFTLLKNEHTMKAWMAALNQKEGTTVQIQKISIKLTLHRALF